MNNVMYITFDWFKISNNKQWIFDLSKVKANLLEQIYTPLGWDVAIGSLGKKLCLTLIDKETIYYTLYGDFDKDEQKLTISNVDYIFLPNEFEYESMKLNFVASPSITSMMDISALQQCNQPPITYPYVLRQHASLLSSKLHEHFSPLAIKNIKNLRKYNRLILGVPQVPYEIITNGYDQYLLLQLEKGHRITVQSLIELGMVIGQLENWNSKKNELTFTYSNHVFPSKKELSSKSYYLVSQSSYKNLIRLMQSNSPKLVYTNKGKADFRFVVKKALKDLLVPYNLKANWRNHSQFFYYANESSRNALIQKLLDHLVESKCEVTAIVESDTQKQIKSTGYIENSVDANQLQQKIQTYRGIKDKLEKYKATSQKLFNKIEKLKLEVKDLNQEIKVLEEEKAAKFEAVEYEKEKLHHLLQKKKAIELQLDELNDTKIFLIEAYEELQELLEAEEIKERAFKKSLEKVYSELTELKKEESIYLDVFRNKSKASSTKLLLKKLETKLEQYKQLYRNIEQDISIVTSQLKNVQEDTLGKIEHFTKIDLTYKVTNNVEKMKALVQQNNEQLTLIEAETGYITQLETYYNTLLEKFTLAKIRISQISFQPFPLTKQEVDFIFHQLIQLLENQPKGIFSNLFKNGHKDWQQQVSDYFVRFMSAFKYWKDVANEATTQKEKLNKHIQMELHQYGMHLKNGLYDKKHETVNQFMRETEIKIAEIYAELFKLNREQKDKLGNLKYFDESLNEETFKERKSSLQIEMTELISVIRDLSSSIQLTQTNLNDYSGKIQLLKKEVSEQAEKHARVEQEYLLVENRFEKLSSNYKSAQALTSKKINDVEKMYQQIEKAENDSVQLLNDLPKYEKVKYLSILQMVYDKRHEIKQSKNRLTVWTPQSIGQVSGITVIENIQNLSLNSLMEITQQADYIIAFCPVHYDYLTAPVMKLLQNGRQKPVLVDSLEMNDECVVQLLNQSYSSEFNVKKDVHDISTNHIRNDQYITWITDENSVTSTLKMLLKELNDSRKILIEEQIVVSKLRVKLFSDQLRVMEHLHENHGNYSRRFHHIKLVKQLETNEDINIVHFSDSNTFNQQVLLNRLLLQRKPLVIITSSSYLNQPMLEPMFAILTQYKRIRESGHEKQWTTAIKPKIK